MNEKKKLIIESAIKLFAKKGFSSTSIQEITNECGISKGSFYLYYKSKESLLPSIIEYYFEEFNKEVSKYDQDSIPARDKFSKQLTAMMNIFITHKDFFIMQAREEAIPLNEEVRALLLKSHEDLQTFYKKSLLSIYGPEVKPYIVDITIMLNGIFQSFTKILLMDLSAFHPEDLSRYIIRRLDSIVSGLKDEKVLMSEEKLSTIVNHPGCLASDNKQNMKAVLNEMKMIVLSLEDKENLEISLEVLGSEIEKKNPRIPVIQGMLSNFNHIEALNPLRKSNRRFL